MHELQGKVAVITGAASGIGRALVLRLASDGMSVVAADVDTDGLRQVVREVAATGREAISVATDVRDAAAMAALAQHVEERFGGVDLLCLNAGVFRGGLVWESPVADWDWVLSVNLYGVIHGLRAFVPGMLRRGSEAHIEITSSMAGLVATGMSGIYTVSKFAVVALAECLANDLRAVGAPIGVSVLTPSAVATAIGDSQRSRRDRPGPDAGADRIEEILRDFCAAGLAPDDVAKMVVDGVRRGDFLIPTKDGFAEFIRVRAEALMRRELPPFQMFD